MTYLCAEVPCCQAVQQADRGERWGSVCASSALQRVVRLVQVRASPESPPPSPHDLRTQNIQITGRTFNTKLKTFWAFGSLYYCVFNCYRERLLPLVLTSLSGLRCNAMPSSWSVLGAVVRHDSGSAAGIIPDEKNSCCNSLSTDGRRAGFDWSCNTIIEAAGLRSDDGILSTLHWD